MVVVPLNPSWADSGSKLDLHAVYRGKPGDDRYAVLPVRRHNDWAAKGMTFVSLASAEDVLKVSEELRQRGVNMTALAASYLNGGRGAFDVQAYIAEQPKRDEAEAEALKARLNQIEGGKKAKKGAEA